MSVHDCELCGGPAPTGTVRACGACVTAEVGSLRALLATTRLERDTARAEARELRAQLASATQSIGSASPASTPGQADPITGVEALCSTRPVLTHLSGPMPHCPVDGAPPEEV